MPCACCGAEAFEPAERGCRRHAKDFCRECMRAWVVGRVEEGVIEVRCPGLMGDEEERARPVACPALMSDECLRAILGGEEWDKLVRRRALRRDPLTTTCPGCGELNVACVDASDVRCKACEAMYCRDHGGRHLGVSCEAWAQTAQGLSAAEDERVFSEVCRQMTAKPCPKCGAPTEKSRGCNHVVCTSCGAHWCFLCARPLGIAGPGGHYSPFNYLGCPGMQMHERESRARRRASACAVACFPCLCVGAGLGMLVGGILVTVVGLGMGLTYAVVHGAALVLLACVLALCGIFDALSRRRASAPVRRALEFVWTSAAWPSRPLGPHPLLPLLANAPPLG